MTTPPPDRPSDLEGLPDTHPSQSAAPPDLRPFSVTRASSRTQTADVHAYQWRAELYVDAAAATGLDLIRNMSGTLPSPQLLGALFRLIDGRLASRVIGQEHVRRRVALLGVQHVLRMGPRLVLAGGSGSGKTTAMRALVAALRSTAGVGVPSAAATCTEWTETGWEGPSLGSLLMASCHADGVDAHSQGPSGVATLLSDAVILLDEFDKLATRRRTSASSRDALRGKQRSLLEVLAGAGLPLPANGHVDVAAVANLRRATVVCAGVFKGIPYRDDERIAAARLEHFGLMAEIVGRLGGPAWVLAPLSHREFARVLRRELDPTIEVFQLFGIALEIPDTTTNLVAQRARQDPTLGARAAIGLLRATAERRLLTALGDPEFMAQRTRRVVLSPDDVLDE